MERLARRCLAMVVAGVLLLGGCDSDGVESPELGVACDPCGHGVDFVRLVSGVQSTCGSGLACVAATFSLQPFGPGVCVRTRGSTTCQGTITDSGGTKTNQCTYTATDRGYDVFCF